MKLLIHFTVANIVAFLNECNEHVPFAYKHHESHMAPRMDELLSVQGNRFGDCNDCFMIQVLPRNFFLIFSPLSSVLPQSHNFQRVNQNVAEAIDIIYDLQ